MDNKWIIVVQGDCYYTHATKNNLIRGLDPNFEDAIIYENETKEEVNKIAKEIYKDCRCFWWIESYDKELIAYIKRTYVDVDTKKYKWGRYLEIIEALKLAKDGVIIGYQYDNASYFIEDGKLPDYLSTELIINAKWRVIELTKI